VTERSQHHSNSHPHDSPHPGGSPLCRLLVTAGPTQEPIDAVRFIGNRSSGRLGVLLADRAAARGWPVTLLLGPTHLEPAESGVELVRYRTTTELGELLVDHQPACGVLVMAAAVADYRPKVEPGQLAGKLKRSGGGMVIELEATEDLLAGCSKRREPGQLLVGFALEPRERMLESARAKLVRKGIDLIVANPLETMEAATIEAVVLGRDGSEQRTDGAIGKGAFAEWLLDVLDSVIEARGVEKR
jgi:phosphopantothenoylcysteine decarboxylase/phosphopantothenate--cysteine ligase